MDQSCTKVIQTYQSPIPTIGYFILNGYISDMHKFYRYIPIAVLVLGLTTVAAAQEGSYILRRQIFNVPLTSINCSPDGSLLLAGFDDGAFRIMDPESFELSLEVENAHYKAVNAMDMPPKMDFILSAGHNSIKLWDRKGKFLSEWKGHATTIWNVEISKDGKKAVSSAMNKTFLLWDVYEGVQIERMRAHEDVCMAVSISPDMRLIASGSNDLTIKIWDMETLQVISTLHGPTQDIYDLEFSPDSRLLVAASKDKSARLYDVAGAELLHILKGHSEMVLEAEFSPDGRYLVTASADRSLILWDVQKGEKIHQFLDNEQAVMDLVYHPDGHSIYSISYAGDLTRWAVHPEIFVLKHFEESYLKELSANSIFEAKRKGESKKEYLSRQQEAVTIKAEIIDRYYKLYLTERDP
jgi:WD40 repeat protein